MNLTVRAVPGDVDGQLDRKARQAPDDIRDGLDELGQLGEGIARALAPSFSGSYADKMTHTVEGAGFSQLVKIGSKSRKAHLVERGRGPGRMPPPRLMAAIFGIDIHAGFTVARRIGRNGTKGHHVLERTRDALDPHVDRIGRQVLEAMGDLHR